MKQLLLNLAAALLGMTLAGSAMAATPAISTADVNLRAGPGTDYPVVRVVPLRAPIVSHGCLADYSWCDIGHAGARGWVAARYVAFIEGRTPVVMTPAVAVRYHVPVVVYSPTYWHRHYVGYPWYARGPAHYRPVPYRPVAAPCRFGCTIERGGTGPRGNSWERHVVISR